MNINTSYEVLTQTDPQPNPLFLNLLSELNDNVEYCLESSSKINSAVNRLKNFSQDQESNQESVSEKDANDSHSLVSSLIRLRGKISFLRKELDNSSDNLYKLI